jgi:RimJ/RimL family protein N-acetyltransferase
MTTPVLESARLTLDAITALDVEPIYEYCQDADIQRFTRVPVPYERAHAAEFTSGATHTESSCLWAVRRDAALVGTAELRFTEPGVAECGYWIGAPFRGQGLMTEALGRILDHAFDDLGLDRVTWDAAVGNTASATVVQRNGFAFDGTAPLGLELRGERFDAWLGSLRRTDDRAPKSGWPL